MAIAVLGSAHAQVTSCSSADAPTPCNTAASCALDGTNVCMLSGSTLICDFNAVTCEPPTTGAGGQMYATHYNDGVSAWGACVIGGAMTNFCCHVDDDTGTIQKVQLGGTPWSDEPLSFNWNGGAINLEPTGPKSTMVGEAYGRAGEDRIHGSFSIDKSYSEVLLGQNGKDFIYGHDGDDTLKGGTQRDNLIGGDGDDRIEGGNGNDILRGGDGDDELIGGDGNDEMEGNKGADVLHGGDGDDKLYGHDIAQTETDVDSDVLYGALGTDELYGGYGDDYLCESATSGPPPNYTCQVWYMEGGPGDDYAHIPPHPTCGNISASAPLGNNDVEEARSGGSYWWGLHVLDSQAGVEVGTTAPYAQCADAWNLDGY